MCLNRPFVFSMVLEHSPGWIINSSRKEWILKAIKIKDLEFLQLLNKTIRPFIKTTEYFEAAAGVENNIPIMQYLLSLDCPFDHLQTLLSAAKNGALNNIKWLETKGFPLGNRRLLVAASGKENNIPMMEYLTSFFCGVRPRLQFDVAIRSCAFNNIKWMLKKDSNLTRILLASLSSTVPP